ncbi:MAG: GPR endopeptidase [Oscillospiraceae bacterium]|nr:GPR endopeptidase [Oscillospiraceae bacterium]
MVSTRTDLAVESLENLKNEKTFSSFKGVEMEERSREGFSVTTVSVTDEAGAQAVGKPVGRYTTIDLRPYFRRADGFFLRACRCLAAEVQALLPVSLADGVLVAGLGNRAMTADAIGPLALESLLVTRHMVERQRQQFRHLLPVSALPTGVLAQTGMETLEHLRGAVEAVHPAAVIVIDALAARERTRLCATVQLGNTGLVPGSGVGNHRKAINRETLGVPVLALGVPTVIEATHLGGAAAEETLFLTPRDIDGKVGELSRLIGYGLSLALQKRLTVEDITGLLG